MGANNRTEKVKFYIRNFMKWHEKGYKVPEIAEICKISCGHAYGVLQEVADLNGVERDELLLVKSWHKSQSGNSDRAVKPLVDGEELNLQFQKTVNDIDNIIKKIDSMIGE